VDQGEDEVKSLIIAAMIVAGVAPVQAQDITPRELLGITVGAIVGYELTKQRDEPRPVIQQQQVVIAHRHEPRKVCWLRQLYNAGGPPVIVQECQYQ
jgi:hypothetical protein